MNSLEIHSIDETGRGVVGSKLLEKKEIKADQHEQVDVAVIEMVDW